MDEFIEKLREREPSALERLDRDALRRFLRSRNHDVAKAIDAVVATLAWRDKEGIDSIMETFDFPERQQLFEMYPEGFFCTDDEGRPVYYQRPGGLDLRKLNKFTSLQRAVRYHLRKQEWMLRDVLPAASIAAGRRIHQNTLVLDLHGIGVTSLAGDVGRVVSEILRVDQDHYPELMARCIVIRAPTSFKIIWKLVRPLLNPRTRDKVTLCSGKSREALAAAGLPLEHVPTLFKGDDPRDLMGEPGPWRDPEILKRVRAGEDKKLPDIMYA